MEFDTSRAPTPELYPRNVKALRFVDRLSAISDFEEKLVVIPVSAVRSVVLTVLPAGVIWPRYEELGFYGCLPKSWIATPRTIWQ